MSQVEFALGGFNDTLDKKGDSQLGFLKEHGNELHNNIGLREWWIDTYITLQDIPDIPRFYAEACYNMVWLWELLTGVTDQIGTGDLLKWMHKMQCNGTTVWEGKKQKLANNVHGMNY